MKSLFFQTEFTVPDVYRVVQKNGTKFMAP